MGGRKRKGGKGSLGFFFSLVFGGRFGPNLPRDCRMGASIVRDEKRVTDAVVLPSSPLEDPSTRHANEGSKPHSKAIEGVYPPASAKRASRRES